MPAPEPLYRLPNTSRKIAISQSAEAGDIILGKCDSLFRKPLPINESRATRLFTVSALAPQTGAWLAQSSDKPLPA